MKHLDPIFATLAPPIGFGPAHARPREGQGAARPSTATCTADPNGAGHFVKMVHNGIEYGIMAAYAEGLNILQHANVGKQKHTDDAETTPLRDPEHYQYDFNLTDIAEVWRRGSVIASWLLDLTAHALLGRPAARRSSRGGVSDSGEGRWTIDAAIDEGVPAYVLTRGALRALQFARRGRLCRQAAVRDALRVRRARGEE